MREPDIQHIITIVGYLLFKNDDETKNKRIYNKIISLPFIKNHKEKIDHKNLKQINNDILSIEQYIDENSTYNKSESVAYIHNLKYAERVYAACFIIEIIWNLHIEIPVILSDCIDRISHIINITSEDAGDIFDFWFDPSESKHKERNRIKSLLPKQTKDLDKLEGNWVESNIPHTDLNKVITDKITSKSLIVLLHEKTAMFLIRCADDIPVFKNDCAVSNAFIALSPGDKAEFKGCASLSYRDIKRYFIDGETLFPLEIELKNIEFSIKAKKIITPFSMKENQGNLVGILGNEGSGKSTLLKLIAGKIFSTNGEVLINGYDLKQYQFQLKSMIGYVPEEDLLFDELTVYENIYLSGKLFLSKLKKRDLEKRVDDILEILDIKDIKNLVVGKFEDKIIQPSQRRLVNIALELIRNPALLVIDNALAPLSMSDASKVLTILHRLSLQGKLVFTSIGQTSTGTFLNFDKIILLNKEGQVVYYGSPENTSELYQEQRSSILQADELLDRLDHLHKRKILQDDLNTEKSESKSTGNESVLNEDDSNKKVLPGNISQIPTLHRQYFILCLRNFKVKLSLRKELIFMLGSAILLSVLLSLVCRYTLSDDYSYGSNPNIPLFIFSSIMINFFLGLVLSGKEIYRERNVIQREEYHNINKFSYVNSKITYLFIIGALLSLLFVIISHHILEIPGFILISWGIYGSSFAFGILLGLIFSVYFKHYETILLKAIPISVLIQILLSESMIIIPKITDKNDTPILCELIPAKWSYEALMVSYFCDNEYQKLNLEDERFIKNAEHMLNTLIPALENTFNDVVDHKVVENNHRLLQDISKLLDTMLLFNKEIFPFEFKDDIKKGHLTDEIIEETYGYIEYLKYIIYEKMLESESRYERIHDSLNNALGEEGFKDFYSQNHNLAVESIVSSSGLNIITFGHNNIKADYPIYYPPSHNYGKSRMFQARKQFNNLEYYTPDFNISVLWIFNMTLYLVLIFVPSRFRHQ